MARAIADWWDSVELWLTQLAFPFQVLLAIVVIVPLCWFVAAGVDRLVDVVSSYVAETRGRE
ncbi:hypothetical protein [Pseudonocardia sp.]|uniref:hypothetical protein n=1 Tax=Pseudonocardia sp. TaxID=60912 RepID=UPI0026094E95|nr:hypothetical protein [Pseudonocardia sp.]MCW2717355.1 hypothetical protein [Pseudonocardia sp.]MDT7615852.1 hypothetical protein [Pseudonocardiales bacterium]